MAYSSSSSATSASCPMVRKTASAVATSSHCCVTQLPGVVGLSRHRLAEEAPARCPRPHQGCVGSYEEGDASVVRATTASWVAPGPGQMRSLQAGHFPTNHRAPAGPLPRAGMSQVRKLYVEPAWWTKSPCPSLASTSSARHSSGEPSGVAGAAPQPPHSPLTAPRGHRWPLTRHWLGHTEGLSLGESEADPSSPSVPTSTGGPELLVTACRFASAVGDASGWPKRTSGGRTDGDSCRPLCRVHMAGNTHGCEPDSRTERYSAATPPTGR